MVAASGSDAAVAQMADTLVAEGGKPAPFVLHLMPRLDGSRKRALVKLILKDTKYLGALNLAEGVEASWLEWPDLANSQTLPALHSAVAGNDDAFLILDRQYGCCVRDRHRLQRPRRLVLHGRQVRRPANTRRQFGMLPGQETEETRVVVIGQEGKLHLGFQL